MAQLYNGVDEHHTILYMVLYNVCVGLVFDYNRIETMEEIVSKFSGKFSNTKKEHEVLVVDKQEGGVMKSSKVFMVGKVLASKLINKESFKRQMWNLWRLKVHVLIFDLEHDRFTFRFNSLSERTTILRGGPWLFNKQFCWF